MKQSYSQPKHRSKSVSSSRDSAVDKIVGSHVDLDQAMGSHKQALVFFTHMSMTDPVITNQHITRVIHASSGASIDREQADKLRIFFIYALAAWNILKTMF